MLEAKKTKNIGTIKLAGQEYDIFIAKSEEQKKQGLQNFESLPSDEGMLFVINEENPVDTFSICIMFLFLWIQSLWMMNLKYQMLKEEIQKMIELREKHLMYLK